MLVTSSKKSYIDPRELRGMDAAATRRILAVLRPFRGRIAAIVLLVGLSAAMGLVPPLLTKVVIDRAIPSRDVASLWWLCTGMLLAALAAGAFQAGQKYLAATIGEQTMLDLRMQIFEHLHELPLGWFSAARPGEAISRVLNDVQGIGGAVSNTLVGILESGVMLAAAAGAIFWLDWRLALLAVALLPLFVIPARRTGRRRKLLKRQAQLRLAEVTGILVETLSTSGALLLKVFGAERFEASRLERSGRALMEASIRQTVAGRWMQFLLGLFETAGPAVMFAAGGWFVIRGSVGLGTVIAFVAVLRRLYQPASQLAAAHVDVLTSYAYFERVFSILDLHSSIVDSPDAAPLAGGRGAVEFRDVALSYGRGSDSALTGVTFSIPPGQSVAIVGASGAGKSSLAALVPRLHDPTHGAVLVDGRDVRTVTLASLRGQMAVVPQETYLFYGTIAENLRYARPDATDAQLEAAARTAQMHDVIAGLPEGYATVVGERGHQLSGGERQRLAIARALLRDPRILILDEATNALDSAAERLLQAALAPLLAGRTSLIIAHRLSTVRHADLVVMLERGRIVAMGRHDELLRHSDAYAGLFAEQLIADTRSNG